MAKQVDWYFLLQETLRETVQDFFRQQWSSDVEENILDDKGFTSDFLDAADMLGSIDVIRIDRTESFTKIYATVIDPPRTSERDIRLLVSDVLRRVDERFLVFMPLHDETHFRFWYMTGTNTHGHEGMVIIKRTDIAATEQEENGKE